MRFGGKFHLCSDSELWTAQWVTSWVRGNETVEVRDWLDCIGGAGMVWRTPPMNFDDVSISLKTLFETATFSGYSDMLVSAIMVKGYGVQPSNKLSVSASAEACFFIFLWLVFGGLVVRPFCITVHLLWLTRNERRVSICSRGWSSKRTRRRRLRIVDRQRLLQPS
jgi:hypothetical protein